MKIAAKSKGSTLRFIAILVTIFLVLLPFAYTLYKMGVFAVEPEIKHKAKNEYEQTIRAVADRDFAPYSFFNEKGEISGYDVELLNEVANRLGKNVEIRLLKWSEALRAVGNGEADILMGKEVSTSAANSAYALTISTAYDTNMIWAVKPVKSFTELHNKAVGIIGGDTFRYYAERVFQCRAVTEHGYGDVLQGCVDGKYEYAMCRKAVGSVIAYNKGLDIQPYIPCSTSYMCFAAMRINQPLINEIDEVLHKMSDDGTLRSIQDRWFGYYAKHRPLHFVLAENQDAYLIMLFLLVAWLTLVKYTYSKMQYDKRLLELTEKSNRSLSEAAATAEAASKAKTEFLFSMSHDIRTPMNAILGYTDIGLHHIDDLGKVEENLRKIKLAGSHLLNLINDILEMSRIESGNVEIAAEPTDIRELVFGIDDMSKSLAFSKELDFRTIIGEISDPYVYADELHVNEIVVNLISNAVKYTQPGGWVRYTVSQRGAAQDGKILLCFEVTDSGIGMSEDFQAHLFEAFSREQSTTVSKQEGTGLGLSIVKRIVDLAGGTISARSKQGEGSTFTVVLPFKVMDDKAIEVFLSKRKETGKVEKRFALKGKRVLLAEDNEMNREIATEILMDAGLCVETAEDGEIAVRLVKEKGTEYYGAILMDIQMPVMGGYEATKLIRELPGGDRIPIIALSANAFKEDVERSLAAGLDAHLAKPIDVKELLETLAKWLDKSSSESWE